MDRYPPPPACGVAEWSDDRRRERLRATRLGAGWRRFGGARRALARVFLCALLPLLVAAGHYWAFDVAPERLRLARTSPVVHHVHDAADPFHRGTAVVVLVGLGNLDASDTARALPSWALLGRVWAVRYDNSGLDTAVIGRLVAERARGAGVRRLVLVGHSMGGVVALEVAQHLHEGTELGVLAVVLDCTPVDLHAVRRASRDAGGELLRWVGWVPGARESRALRFVVEVAARKDRFLSLSGGWSSVDGRGLRAVAGEVLRDKVRNPGAASNGLIAAQFRAIAASGAGDNLDALARPHGGKAPPALVLLRPVHRWSDPVVDVERTQRALVERVGLPTRNLLVVRMADTGHANPVQRPTEYNHAVQARVVPYLERRARSQFVEQAALAGAR